MFKREAIMQLEELVEEIYEKLDEIEGVLGEVAPGELERAKSYWLAHIDGALLNKGGYLGGSFISLEDTLEALREGDDNVMEQEGSGGLRSYYVDPADGHGKDEEESL